MALSRIGFPYVYGAAEPPRHPDFRFEWRDSLDIRRDGNALRVVFVAARRQLTLPSLIPLVEPD